MYNLFKVTEVLTLAAEVSHCSYQDFHDGWIQGRKDLAKSLLNMLSEDFVRNAFKAMTILVSSSSITESNKSGTVWVTNGKESRGISVGESIPFGFRVGSSTMEVESEDYSDGWKQGRKDLAKQVLKELGIEQQ